MFPQGQRIETNERGEIDRGIELRLGDLDHSRRGLGPVEGCGQIRPMDQQSYRQVIGRRNLVRNDRRLQEQLRRLVRSFTGQPCEQVALHVELIPESSLPFEGRFIVRHGHFYGLVIIQAEAEPRFRKRAKFMADGDDGLYDGKLLLQGLSPEVRPRHAGGEPQTHFGLFCLFGGRLPQRCFERCPVLAPEVELITETQRIDDSQ